MRSGRCGSLSSWTLVAFMVLVGCTDKETPSAAPPPDSWVDVCVDDDHDGYGFQCENGDDCDDDDSAVFEGCKACFKAAEGCDCEADSAPIDCTLPKEVSPEGTLLCKSGTRYCRDQKWSGCEGIKTFAAPPPSRLLSTALLDPDAGPVVCSACLPDCYQVKDTLEPDASYNSDASIVAGPNGGITLHSRVVGGDGGVFGEGGTGTSVDSGLLDDGNCIPGTAPDFDCDGLPDEFDPYPAQPPFSSDHNTIFMDLGPGDTQEESFEIRFYLNTADIYLYLDMTGSMDGERTNLINSLRTGNYLTNGGVGLQCADRNFDGSTADEEGLKSDGVAGNLACLIRDSRLGTGWHRDLPFARPDAAGYAYGPHDFEMFEHKQDITDDVDAVLAALTSFNTRGGINRPEGGIMGLYALATGGELYVGWDRPGNPGRTTCPAGTWGYPCFRDDAVPIVIWMTDAPITNGPAPTQGNLGPDKTVYCNNCVSPGVNYFSSTQPLFWDPASLAIEKGSDGKYNVVPDTNDTFGTAYDIGAINSSFKTYTGNTSKLASNYTYDSIGFCGVTNTTNAWSTAQQGAPDAVFKFTVTEAEPITISTRGSRFQTSLAILDANRINGVSPLVGNVASPTAGGAQSLGTFGTDISLGGSIASGDAATFTRDVLGSCLANTSASDRARAQVLRFNLASDVSQLRILSNSGFTMATALFAGQPSAPADTDLTTISVPYGTTTRLGNSNDYFGGYNIGDVTGSNKRFIGGTTADTDLTLANFPASIFQSVAACSTVSSTSRDAVFDFSLSARTQVHIEGTGSASSMAAGFDHVLGLVKRTTNTHQNITGNTTDGSAYLMSAADMPDDATIWSQYTGVLGGSATQYIQSEVGPFQTPTTTADCTNAAANSGGFQAVFALDVTQTQSYDFNTAGSGLAPTWISIHEDYADVQRSVAVGTANPNNANTTLANAFDLGALDESSVMVTGGDLNSSPTPGAAAADFVNLNTLGTTCGSGNGGRDAVYRFTVSANQTISATIGSATGTPLVPGNPAFNTFIALYRGGLSNAERVAGDCVDQGGTGTLGSSLTNVAVTPGATYYLLVKSVSATGPTTGTYGIWLRDTTFSSHFKGCDTASDTNAAKITRSLTAGHRYYVVVKGATTGAAYTLNVRRTPVTDVKMLDCNRNAGGTSHAVIERWLDPGNYSVIIRGYSTANGTYQLVMRDMSVAPTALGCQYDSNSATPSSLTVNNLLARDSTTGALIDYYVVMRANSSGTGAYTMHIDKGEFARTQCAVDNTSMVDTVNRPAAWISSNSGSTYTDSSDINNAEWKGTLPVGTYYAILKGYDTTPPVDVKSGEEDRDWGMYQLSIGDQTNFEQFGTFQDQRWLGAAGDGTSGVRKALLDRHINVITVDSTTGSPDDATYSDQQMSAVAQSTGAVALDGTPLFFKINSNGTGLGTAIVNAVNQLAGNLAMDVSVRLVESPDSPAPKRFNFRAEAIDTVGDLCQPPVDTDNDAAHTPDTHVHCTPGAVPRFKVTLSNAFPPNNVPSNPADALGGYNMRLDLIGDGQYVVDTIPLYIIPEDVVEEPGDTRFDPIGVYEQTLSASGCMGNEAPIWRELSWSADIPSGTTLTWNVCTAETEAELASCSLQTAAVVQTGSECVSDDNCPNGYCNDSNVCEFVIGPSCGSSDACGINGVCVAGRCQWINNPIDVKPALVRSLQGKSHARVQAVLQSNAAHTRAPTVTSWGLIYTCTAQE